MKLLLLLGALPVVFADTLKPSCERPIYCNSKLLHHVEMARILMIPKPLLTCKLNMMRKQSCQALSHYLITSSFLKSNIKTDGKPTQEQLQEFIENNLEPRNELEKSTPSDFNSNPAFLASIKDKKLRQFGKAVNNIWPVLGVKLKSIVDENPDRFSLIPTLHGIIIPSGRFR